MSHCVFIRSLDEIMSTVYSGCGRSPSGASVMHHLLKLLGFEAGVMLHGPQHFGRNNNFVGLLHHSLPKFKSLLATL